MTSWRDCAVSLIDLVGVKEMAVGRRGEASSLMRKMHEEVITAMRTDLPLHAHAYVWNDSVVLLAFLDRTHR